MTQTAELTPDLDYVEAELDYIVDDGIPAVRYLDWPEMEHLAHKPAYEKHLVRIHNGRTDPAQFALPSHGFAFVDHHTKVRDFYDEEEAFRHDSAVKTQWSEWSRIARALRNPNVGAPITWAQWSALALRLRAHVWHQQRRIRLIRLRPLRRA